MLLPGWGPDTQEKLKRSKVCIVGAGGLGCPAALNLTLAGVGHIKICDGDTVETTNLNRQFLHLERSIGKNKAESAKETLSYINSEITVEPVVQRITEENVDDIVGDAEIILDCLDNFDDRHTLNMCAIRKNIPMVHGAVWGVEGRLTFLHVPSTPCLTCIFPKAGVKGEFPILGAVSCTIGSLQAVETLKYLTGQGTVLSGRMLIMDGLTMKCQELEVAKDPNCPACSHL
jgi:adenylyltransferase/sulfurtransferase